MAWTVRLISTGALASMLILGPAVPGLIVSASTIQHYTISIGKLRQEISNHLDKIRQTGSQETNLLQELKAIDLRLSSQKDKILALNKRLHAQQELLALKNRELQRAKQARENVKKYLIKRLRAFYLTGRTTFLNVAFSRESLPELLLFDDAFQRLIDYNHSVITLYRRTIADLQRVQQALQLEKELLAEFIAQEKEEQRNMAAIRKEKEHLLHRIRTQKKLYQQALREMHQAEQELATRLSSLKKEKLLEQEGFVRQKGHLPAPVAGHLVYRFGDSMEQGTISQGLTIATPPGTPVRAIYPGRVILATYKLGFGKTVIIDHGLRYFTITSRLDTIRVHTNDQVKGGDIIGTTGDIATLFHKGLSFEIRHGAQPLDPLKWLQPSIFPAPTASANQGKSSPSREP